MPELIYKAEVMRIINAENAVVLCNEKRRTTYEVLVDIFKELNALPTIEPEVRHGRWIPTEYDSYADGAPVLDKWECSECGHEHKGEEDTLTAFCPDCGADMREEGAYNG